MAIGRVSINTHSRKRGHQLAAVIAYRSAISLVCPRTGEVHDYSHRSGVKWTGMASAYPTPYTASCEAFVAAGERAERRKDARISRDVQSSIPHELPYQAKVEVTREFGRELAKTLQTAVASALHGPGTGDDRNWHGHHVLYTRKINGDGTIGAKIPGLDNPMTAGRVVKRIRKLHERIVNKALEKAGINVRINVGKNISGDPAPTLGNACAALERHAAEADGIDTTGMSIAEVVCARHGTTGRRRTPVTRRGKALALHMRRKRFRQEHNIERVPTTEEIVEALEKPPIRLSPPTVPPGTKEFAVALALPATPRMKVRTPPLVQGRYSEQLPTTPRVAHLPSPEPAAPHAGLTLPAALPMRIPASTPSTGDAVRRSSEARRSVRTPRPARHAFRKLPPPPAPPRRMHGPIVPAALNPLVWGLGMLLAPEPIGRMRNLTLPEEAILDPIAWVFAMLLGPEPIRPMRAPIMSPSARKGTAEALMRRRPRALQIEPRRISPVPMSALAFAIAIDNTGAQPVVTSERLRGVVRRRLAALQPVGGIAARAVGDLPRAPRPCRPIHEPHGGRKILREHRTRTRQFRQPTAYAEAERYLAGSATRPSLSARIATLVRARLERPELTFETRTTRQAALFELLVPESERRHIPQDEPPVPCPVRSADAARLIAEDMSDVADALQSKLYGVGPGSRTPAAPPWDTALGAGWGPRQTRLEEEMERWADETLPVLVEDLTEKILPYEHRTLESERAAAARRGRETVERTRVQPEQRERAHERTVQRSAPEPGLAPTHRATQAPASAPVRADTPQAHAVEGRNPVPRRPQTLEDFFDTIAWERLTDPAATLGTRQERVFSIVGGVLRVDVKDQDGPSEEEHGAAIVTAMTLSDAIDRFQGDYFRITESGDPQPAPGFIPESMRDYIWRKWLTSEERNVGLLEARYKRGVYLAYSRGCPESAPNLPPELEARATASVEMAPIEGDHDREHAEPNQPSVWNAGPGRGM